MHFYCFSSGGCGYSSVQNKDNVSYAYKCGNFAIFDDNLASWATTFQGFLCIQQISRKQITCQDFLCRLISNLICKKVEGDAFLLISSGRYLWMNADPFSKKLTESFTVIRLQMMGCVSVSVFCLFCSPHRLFTCMLPKHTVIYTTRVVLTSVVVKHNSTTPQTEARMPQMPKSCLPCLKMIWL